MRTRRQRLAELKAAHNHPTYAKMAFVMGCKVQDRGRSRVSDDEGRSFLAMFDQYGNQSFGYSHPRIVAAVREQLDTGVLNSTKIMFEDVQIRLSERLAQITGQRLPYSYLANGGGETIDNALKLARAATGRPGVISARGCFHGKTFATLSASNRPEHRAHLAPFMEHFRQVTFGDTAELAAALDDSVGAVLLEPVQAEAGVIVPPPDYLREVRRLCTEAGALLILDEMQTAFGRCGTFFAYEQFGIVPDLVCVGKAFGGGVLPVSAVLGTEEVWKVLRELPSTFGSSLGGNPLSCRVGLESVAIASDPLFLDGVRERARMIEQRLTAAAERHPGVVAAHRGVGMMHGLEFHDQALAGLVLGRLLEEGITSTYSLYNPGVLRVQPPWSSPWTSSTTACRSSTPSWRRPTRIYVLSARDLPTAPAPNCPRSPAPCRCRTRPMRCWNSCTPGPASWIRSPLPTPGRRGTTRSSPDGSGRTPWSGPTVRRPPPRGSG